MSTTLVPRNVKDTKIDITTNDDLNTQSRIVNRASASLLKTIFYILGNVASSVLIIIVNKAIMTSYGFNYSLVLTLLHFSFMSIFFGALIMLKLIEVRSLPLRSVVYIAVSNVGSIVLMNMSLHYNSVGFYQTSKLACIPAMVLVETFVYGKTFSTRVKLSLALLCFGVGIVTITDVKLNVLGAVIGVGAVLATTVSQVAISENQKIHNIHSFQMLEAIVAPQFLVSFLIAIPAELVPNADDIIRALQVPNLTYLIGLSCVLSVSVNVFFVALVGATSAVTYQVVGHSKTCLVLVLGFLFFPVNMKTDDLVKNITGIVFALFGTILYGHYKNVETEKKVDTQ
ncbi:hypothetical protein AKO1_009013 [Acrasis kona]|uniref:Sugar phosphate transporter domain-containing protein n=1 Tax=Acrasis kona TaxID=1008807 RepID=A0AAW2ZI90_9EUKA